MMFFRLLKSKKAFTLVETMMVVVVMGILSAAAVPIFVSAYQAEARKDCHNQRVVIETLVKEAMTGMLDSGSKQYRRRTNGTLVTPKVAWINFSKVQSDHKTTYVADDIDGNGDDIYDGQECFVLIQSQQIPGKIAFTMGDFRGGYRPSHLKEYKDGTDQGYYLKKKKLENVAFYTYLANQEIPACPFSDPDKPEKTYYYYIFADGTVLCSCPECHE